MITATQDIPIERPLQFEELLVELTAQFINPRAEGLDDAIEDAQRLICENLKLDRSALFLVCSKSPETFLLTHVYQSPETGGPAATREPGAHLSARRVRFASGPDSPQPYVEIELRSCFPWTYDQLRNRQTVVIPDIEALPAEAAIDQNSLRDYGAKSSVIVPLFTGAELLGCLTFAAMRGFRPWSRPLINRLELVANVFRNALVRSRGEQVLRESQTRLALATESAGAGLWSFDPETRQIWVTARTRQLFEFSPDESITLDALCRTLHPDDRQSLDQAAQHALQTGQELVAEHRVVAPNGNVKWISTRGRPFCGPSGRLECLTGASIDITERKSVEAQLRESEQRFRALVEQAGDGFELIDEEGRYLDVNAATLRQLGYTREEMLRMSVFEVDPSLRRDEFKKNAMALRDAAPLRGESIRRRKDGATFPVEVTVSCLQLGTRQCLLTLARDITDRKMAEAALTNSYAEIKRLKDRLEAETAYLKTEVRVSHAHGVVIGHSPAIKRVLHQVEQVAPVESPVLITGETGTGKELVAQEIHRLSRRKDRLMVMVNCAALPSALVESELFGRERGAYTGALTTQVGRFELADGSTVFLDEVGELSMEVQAKLLRVLQQGEFQRLGNPKTHKVNVRIIAATNRDLADKVRKGSFREDLYYRLKVFPIDIPPLRERIEDIPALVFAFMEEFSTRMGKKVTKVPRHAMEKLQAHSWPGNIRELRNVIERTLILTSGDMLKLCNLGESSIREGHAVTLAEAEREHILKTLEVTGWRIKGPHGAAQRLDVEPSTLYSRMQRLGIPNRRQKDEMASGELVRLQR